MARIIITLDDFREGELARWKIDQVCRNCSIYGNDLIVITDEDIEALKNGGGFCIESTSTGCSWLIRKEKRKNEYVGLGQARS